MITQPKKSELYQLLHTIVGYHKIKTGKTWSNRNRGNVV